MAPRRIRETLLAAAAFAAPPVAAQGPPDAVMQQYKPGPRWIGGIRQVIEQEAGPPNFVTTIRKELRVDVRLREMVPPLATPPGKAPFQVIQLEDDGTSASHKETQRGYCTGSAETRFQPQSRSRHGTITRTAQGESGLAAMRWQPETYHLLVPSMRPSAHGYELVVQCDRRSSTLKHRVTTPIIGGPLKGMYADPRAPRTIEGGRMIGTYTNEIPAMKIRQTVSWAICREGIPCPPPPEPGAAKPPPAQCPGLRPEVDRLILAMEQWAFHTRALAAVQAKIAPLANEARQHEGDYKQASQDCRLWKTAEFLAVFLPSPKLLDVAIGYADNGAAGVFLGALDIKETADALFPGLRRVADKALGPRLAEKLQGDNDLSLQDIVDITSHGYSRAGPADWEEAVTRLRGCGAPTIQGVMEGAIRYIRLNQEIAPLAREAATIGNHIRNKELEIFNLKAKYLPVCRAHTQCEGIPEEACNAWPPPAKK